MSLEKLKSAQQLASIRDDLEASGRKLVLTNGCFDLLHVGHVRYLQQSRDLGDALLVAVNGDASVRALKGQTRPINSELDRAEVLAALDSVTYVTIFPSIRINDLVTVIRPQIYAKGGDYTLDTLDQGERRTLEGVGCQIRILPLVPGKSTTALIDKWKS
jgi:rfaE bifunctional protein nucleotidyltransferase chain/domain